MNASEREMPSFLLIPDAYVTHNATQTATVHFSLVWRFRCVMLVVANVALSR